MTIIARRSVIHTHLSLNINPNPVAFGGSVTFTATLTDTSVNPATPIAGAIIDFSNGSTDFGTRTTDSSGVATLTLSPETELPASNTAYNIKATYAILFLFKSS